MNFVNIGEGICIVLCVIAYALVFYYKVKGNLFEAVIRFIALVEETGLTGKEKMKQVIDALYEKVPAPLKKLFTKERLEDIAQWVFDWVREYANTYHNKTDVRITTTQSFYVAELVSEVVDVTLAELKKVAAEYGIQTDNLSTKEEVIKALVDAIAKQA